MELWVVPSSAGTWNRKQVRWRAQARSAGSASDKSQAMRRAEAAHGEHEKRTGQRDADWADWYAAYMVAEQAGEELPL